MTLQSYIGNANPIESINLCSVVCLHASKQTSGCAIIVWPPKHQFPSPLTGIEPTLCGVSRIQLQAQQSTKREDAVVVLQLGARLAATE